MTKDYTPKISFNVPPDVFQQYMNIDWGLRGKLMVYITKQLFRAIEVHGPQVAYLILAGKLGLFSLPPEKTDG